MNMFARQSMESGPVTGKNDFTDSFSIRRKRRFATIIAVRPCGMLPQTAKPL
jgi:hypothetical protein